MSKTQKLSIFTDGGSRGNPGPAGIGVTVQNQDGDTLFEFSGFIGLAKTNNEAEYAGFEVSLNWLLEYLVNHEVSQVNWFLDSKLVVEQLNGNWQVKKEHLKRIVDDILVKKAGVSVKSSISHVERAKNKRADALVNMALDAMAE